jgi:hypothetical protein
MRLGRVGESGRGEQAPVRAGGDGRREGGRHFFWAVPGTLAEGIGIGRSSRGAQVVRGSARRRVNAAAGSAAQGQRASSRKVLCRPLRSSCPAAAAG